MEKRAFARAPSFLNAKLFCDDYSYDVFILNFSQNGIFFTTKACLSSGLNIKLSIPLKTTELTVPFEIVRMSKISMLYSGFGAKNLSPSQEYIKFIDSRIA